jgi:hypothetical protein
MIFLGTVTEVILIPDGHIGWSPSRAKMRVDRAYKGVSEAALTLYDDGMCDGPELEVGEQYLMYTHRNEDGGIPSRGCTRSRHVKFAEEDLWYLESLNEAAPTARVYGSIVAWPEDSGDRLPLAGAIVKLAGPVETVTTNADDKGRYSFEGLIPGKYSVSASQPGFDMPLRDYGLFSAEVTARGCAAINVTLAKHWPGTVSGRLMRSDGTPASAGIDLTLYRITENGDRDPIGDEVLTDERGAYEFQSVRAGRYKIALHPCCFPTGKAPYRPIYWPAATNEDNASEIVIDEASGPRKYDFHLPPELRSVTAHGVVRLPSGKAAGGVKVWILRLSDEADADTPKACCAVVDEIETDENGRFTFKAIEGIEYGLTTILRAQTVVTFSFSNGPEDLILVHDPSGESKDLR